jgi:hypothetical protein
MTRSLPSIAAAVLAALVLVPITVCQAQHQLDDSRISAAAGTKVTVKDGIVRNEWPRDDVPFTAAFSGSDSLAAVDGDFIMTANEVQPVLKSLRKSGVYIVALHNHMIGEEPQFYFLHFWGKGSTQELAGAIRSALDAQKSAVAKQQ